MITKLAKVIFSGLLIFFALAVRWEFMAYITAFVYLVWDGAVGLKQCLPPPKTPAKDNPIDEERADIERENLTFM